MRTAEAEAESIATEHSYSAACQSIHQSIHHYVLCRAFDESRAVEGRCCSLSMLLATDRECQALR